MACHWEGVPPLGINSSRLRTARSIGTEAAEALAARISADSDSAALNITNHGPPLTSCVLKKTGNTQ